MASRERKAAIIGTAALLAGIGLIGARNARRIINENLTDFRKAACEELKLQLDYDKLKDKGQIPDLEVLFPRTRRWHTVDILVEKVLAPEGASWQRIPYNYHLDFPEDVVGVEEMPTAIKGIYFQKRYTEPKSRIFSAFGDLIANTELYLVGENHLFLPPRFHPGIKSNQES